ncbi:MAG: hypothetical protein WC769_09515 [Thermodesulfovibrionales bacterium]|jgi:hypothetical protein
MKISELNSIMKFIVTSFNKNKVINNFQNFVNVINQLLRNRQQQEVGSHKDKLYESLRNINVDSLPYGQKRILEIFGGDKYIGEKAINAIDSILRDDKFDPVGVTDKITKYFNETNEFFETAQQLVSKLAPFKEVEEILLPKGQAVVQIIFEHASSVESITDLNKWVDQWFKIIRAFGLLTDFRADDAKLIYVQKTSPLVMEIASSFALVLALGKASSMVLDKIEQYLRIKKTIEEVKHLKLKNTKIAKDLEKEAENYKDYSAEEIAKKIIEQINKEKKDDGETSTALKLAIVGIYNFVDKGGKLDYFMPEPESESKEEQSEESKETKELEVVYNRIRKLERDVERMRFLTYDDGKTG